MERKKNVVSPHPETLNLSLFFVCRIISCFYLFFIWGIDKFLLFLVFFTNLQLFFAWLFWFFHVLLGAFIIYLILQFIGMLAYT